MTASLTAGKDREILSDSRFYIICRFKLSKPCLVLIRMDSEGLARMVTFTTWQLCSKLSYKPLQMFYIDDLS